MGDCTTGCRHQSGLNYDPLGLMADQSLYDGQNGQSTPTGQFIQGPLEYSDTSIYEEGDPSDAEANGGSMTPSGYWAPGMNLNESGAPSGALIISIGGNGVAVQNKIAANNGQHCDNACQLAKAINKTGVQSISNPCAIGGWYVASAAVGTAAVPAVQQTAKNVATDVVLRWWQLPSSVQRTVQTLSGRILAGTGAAVNWGLSELNSACVALGNVNW